MAINPGQGFIGNSAVTPHTPVRTALTCSTSCTSTVVPRDAQKNSAGINEVIVLHLDVQVLQRRGIHCAHTTPHLSGRNGGTRFGARSCAWGLAKRDRKAAFSRSLFVADILNRRTIPQLKNVLAHVNEKKRLLFATFFK